MEQRYQRRTREQWQALTEQFAASSLSLAHFCEQHGLGEKTFHNWRLRLNREALSSSFVPVTTEASTSHRHHGDTITVRTDDIVIELPGTVGMVAVGDLVCALRDVE